ncbi:MAG: cell division protein SepF [Acidimicrobiia bacterium]
MSMWRRAMNYLGLGPDEEYYEEEPAAIDRGSGRPGRAPYGQDPDGAVNVRPVPGRSGSAREMSNVREMPVREHRSSNERGPMLDDSQSSVVTRPRQGSAVRTVPAGAAPPRPHAVSPRAFNDAQEVGDRFRDGQPVIVNLEGVERELSRRIIDFTSGLCYALSGRMERVANGVYLLTPASVDVSDEERRRYSEHDE